MSKPSVFIGSSVEGLPVARAIAGMLETDCRILQWTGSPFSPGKPLVQSLRGLAEEADWAVFILTPDDMSLRREGGEQIQQNILFELGLFIGMIGIDRTMLLCPSGPELRIPSDIQGLATLSYGVIREPGIEPSVAPAVAQLRRRIVGTFRSREKRPEYYSCFISYSSRDQDFVAKLYNDLRDSGVRSWLDEKDLRIGDSLSGQISRAIEAHDKVLLVLSQASVGSPWVHQEVRNALSLEAEQKRVFLFPIRIDDAVFSEPNSPLEIVRSRYIGDFTNWREGGAYQRSFSRLVRDLAITTSVELGGQK